MKAPPAPPRHQPPRQPRPRHRRDVACKVSVSNFSQGWFCSCPSRRRPLAAPYCEEHEFSLRAGALSREAGASIHPTACPELVEAAQENYDTDSAAAATPHNPATKTASTRNKTSGPPLASSIAFRRPAPPGTPCVNHEANCFILPTASGN